jgi:serine/threonine protein kinase
MAQATDDDETPLPPRRKLWARLREALSGPSGSAPEPERIGRYRVLGRLGEGGMGVVYEVLDESLGRHVAVKTIREPDPSTRKRFRREARAAASVNHPNVCQLFEIGEDGGRLFIAMELLSGTACATAPSLPRTWRPSAGTSSPPSGPSTPPASSTATSSRRTSS